MFFFTSTQKAAYQAENGASERDGCETFCLYSGNLALRTGLQAGYNALGYALLAGNPLMTPGLTINAAIQSGVIGIAVFVPFTLCSAFLCESDECRTSPETTLVCGPCCETLDSVIVSLAGAGVQGLFVNNVTTPAYIAASAATGAAVGIAGVTATILVVAGTTFICGTLYDNRAVLIPTNCLQNFTCKDLVYPCQVGLNICTGEEMRAFLQRCIDCCPKPSNRATQENIKGAPTTETMTRDENENQDDIIQIRLSEIPVARYINDESVQDAIPANPGVELVRLPTPTSTQAAAPENKLTMI